MTDLQLGDQVMVPYIVRPGDNPRHTVRNENPVGEVVAVEDDVNAGEGQVVVVTFPDYGWVEQYDETGTISNEGHTITDLVKQ